MQQDESNDRSNRHAAAAWRCSACSGSGSRLLAHELASEAADGGGVEGGGAAWLVLRAHGTPTMKQWSFDVRQWRTKPGRSSGEE